MVPANSVGHIVHGSNPNVDYRFLELSKGWILVNLKQFNKAANNPNATPTVFNKSNCSSVFSGKGPVQVRCVAPVHMSVLGDRRADLHICGHGGQDRKWNVQPERVPDRPWWWL